MLLRQVVALKVAEGGRSSAFYTVNTASLLFELVNRRECESSTKPLSDDTDIPMPQSLLTSHNCLCEQETIVKG